MSIANITREEGIATVTLDRPKVNAFNEPLVEQVATCFSQLRDDDTIKAVILTGAGKFFSFGLDTGELYDYSQDDMRRFLTKYTSMYTAIFSYPKPVVAALNGHCIAAGCMVALAADYRIMASGRAKMSLNEITFGSSVFAGSIEMLKCCVGQRKAETVAIGGAMYTGDETREIGLVDSLCEPEQLMSVAAEKARELGGKNPPTYACVKNLLRGPVAEIMKKREEQSISDFIEIWYSKTVRENVKKIMTR